MRIVFDTLTTSGMGTTATGIARFPLESGASATIESRRVSISGVCARIAEDREILAGVADDLVEPLALMGWTDEEIADAIERELAEYRPPLTAVAEGPSRPVARVASPQPGFYDYILRAWEPRSRAGPSLGDEPWRTDPFVP